MSDALSAELDRVIGQLRREHDVLPFLDRLLPGSMRDLRLCPNQCRIRSERRLILLTLVRERRSGLLWPRRRTQPRNLSSTGQRRTAATT